MKCFHHHAKFYSAGGMKGSIRLDQNFFAGYKVVRGESNFYAAVLDQFRDCFAHFFRSPVCLRLAQAMTYKTRTIVVRKYRANMVLFSEPLYNILMTDTWRLLITPPARGAWNMAVDESILEHIGRGESLPTLRLYSWQPPCLSLGHAQPFADVDVARLNEHGWDVVRRPTGGRAILHTDELTYSITAPIDEPGAAGSILESYNRLAGALLQAVKSLGLPVEIKEDSGVSHETPNPVCFEVP